MNKKIAKTLLILCIAYMIGYYILKFIFAEQLLLVITDPNIIRLGKLIDGNVIYKYIFNLVTTFMTLLLFVFSSTGRFKLKWYEFMYVVLGTIICKLCAQFTPDLYTHTSISIMFLLALVCKGSLLYSVTSFTIHGYLSQFLFSIRGFETIMTKFTTATAIALMIECYMWLLILSLFFNLKENKNGCSTTISK